MEPLPVTVSGLSDEIRPTCSKETPVDEEENEDDHHWHKDDPNDQPQQISLHHHHRDPAAQLRGETQIWSCWDERAAAAFQLQPDDRKDERSPLPLSDSVCRLFLYLWSQNQTDSLRSTGTFHCQVKNHSSVSEQLLNEQFIIYHFCLLSAWTEWS